MACSDNVGRGELTPKLRATNVLCQTVDYIYVAQESPVFNARVISQNNRLVSDYLCSQCLCYFSFGVVSDNDSIGGEFFVIVIRFSEDIIETIKWCNQYIYILGEESEEYGDTRNDNENYERASQDQIKIRDIYK